MIQLWLEIMFGIALILCIRLLFGRRLGPGLCRWLWLLVMIVPLTLPTEYHPLGLFAAANREALNSVSLVPDISVIPVQKIKEESLEVSLEKSLVKPLEEPIEKPLADVRGSNIESEMEMVSQSQNEDQNSRPDPENGNEVIEVVAMVEDHSEPFAGRFDFRLLLGGVWFLGFLVVFFGAAIRNWQIVAQSMKRPAPVPGWVQEIFFEARKELRMDVLPVLMISPSVSVPCLVGAVRPRILLPESIIEQKNSETIRFVLLHKLTHLKQGDIWFSWLWMLTVAVHWFNPLFWLLGRYVKLDCETACDDRVLTALNHAAQKSYAVSLVEMTRTLKMPAKAGAYAPISLGVIEISSNLERRIAMMTLHKMPTLQRSLLGAVIFMLLAALSLSGYAEQKPISPKKAKMIGYVEDYLMHHFRDVTMRKSLEWSNVKTDDKGNSTIRYRCEALIWDKDRQILSWDFTFDKDGKYVKHEPIEKSLVKDDVPQKENTNLDDLVWDVLGVRYTPVSQDDYQRVAGKQLKSYPHGGIAIERVREGSQFAEKGIKSGDIIIGIDEWVTTSQNDLRYIAKKWSSIPSSKGTVEIKFFRDGQLYFTNIPLNIDRKDIRSETIKKSPVKDDVSKTEQDQSDKSKIVNQYLQHCIAGEFEKVYGMEGSEFRIFMTKEKLAEIWDSASWGNFEKMTDTSRILLDKPPQNYSSVLEILEKTCQFERQIVTFRISVNDKDEIVGFFVVNSVPKKESVSNSPRDTAFLMDKRTGQNIPDTNVPPRHFFGPGPIGFDIQELQLPVSAEYLTKILSAGQLKEPIPDWFIERDRDKNGRLTLEYYANLPTEDIPLNMKKEFQLLDANSDGIVTIAEVQTFQKNLDNKKKEKESKIMATDAWRALFQGNPKEAILMFQTVIELDPKNANAYQGLGWALFNYGASEKAKVGWAKCLELDPKNAAALNGLGSAAWGEGKKDDAIEHWKKAVAAEKNATAALSGLAKAYEEKGDKENAAKYYQLWLEADPNDANAKQGIEKMK